MQISSNTSFEFWNRTLVISKINQKHLDSDGEIIQDFVVWKQMKTSQIRSFSGGSAGKKSACSAETGVQSGVRTTPW